MHSMCKATFRSQGWIISKDSEERRWEEDFGQDQEYLTFFGGASASYSNILEGHIFSPFLLLLLALPLDINSRLPGSPVIFLTVSNVIISPQTQGQPVDSCSIFLFLTTSTHPSQVLSLALKQIDRTEADQDRPSYIEHERAKDSGRYFLGLPS